MKFFIIQILISVLTSHVALAKLQKSVWSITNGELSYHVHFPLKNIIGTAKNVKGKGQCQSGDCTFLIGVPVKDFNSGDGNRDNHMLETTKAALQPVITVIVKFKEPTEINQLEATAQVAFANTTHTYEHVAISAKMTGENIEVKGQLPLVLSHFDIDRPSLLGVKIDDSVPLDFTLFWN
ncbi:MAG: hypothetical protein A2Z20_01645 [Bdellovibrionales bacterium RBG_16_40_8]|nr:MAG: hypothetical protein A2Z20_01645 [Bdellovibrionales bacterium RBG_16_40_8]